MSCENQSFSQCLLIADRPFVGIPEDRGFASCEVIQNSCSRKSLGRVVGYASLCPARRDVSRQGHGMGVSRQLHPEQPRFQIARHPSAIGSVPVLRVTITHQRRNMHPFPADRALPNSKFYFYG
jgi:hypothetical protein